MAVFNSDGTTVNSQDEHFFKALGARIASARKAQNLTQQHFVMQMLDTVPTQASH